MTPPPVEGLATYFETRDKIAAARERQLAAALAENKRLRAALHWALGDNPNAEGNDRAHEQPSK